MRLILLTTVTMIAFAANSVLNRMALADGAIGPASFALIRLAAGALTLIGLGLITGRGFPLRRMARVGPALALAVYMLGFSFAYIRLDAGLGALLLFAGVQVTMFAGAFLLGDAMPVRRILGAVIAFAGLVVLLWPTGPAAAPLVSCLFMLAAAVGWGLYSLWGRGVSDPLSATSVNFVLALPVAAVVFLTLPDGAQTRGIVLAVISGAVTSGLGYALWYAILPSLGPSRAAVAQLTAPVIAVLGGMALLGEALSLRVLLAALLVLGGVAFSLIPSRSVKDAG